jgi:glycosyltransferase involved in cell wall biosynthesis
VVVVPVRNEALGLAATLASLAAQRQHDGTPFDAALFEMLLLANNCTDSSALVARQFSAAHPQLALHIEDITLAPEFAHIGHVRRLLMDTACDRLKSAGAVRGIVASTDGDTVVDPFWLAHTSREFTRGADAVGGRIALDPRAPLDAATLRVHRCDAAYKLALARLESLLDPDPHDPWPRHHQHFCASLAVTRDAYLKVGGVLRVRYLEDQALVDAMHRADLRVRHSPHVRVVTSPRCDGRVEVGLSWQLKQWGSPRHGIELLLVDDPSVTLRQIQARQRLRTARQRGGHSQWRAAAASVTDCFGVSARRLKEVSDSTPSFGALWQSLIAQKRVTVSAAQVPIRQATQQLRALIRAELVKSQTRPVALAA